MSVGQAIPGFTLGMVGPCVPRAFAEYLDAPAETIPLGLGGSPVNLLTGELLKRGWHIKLFTLDPELTEERVFHGERLTLCVGPYRPRPRQRARDFFARERAYLRAAIVREQPAVLHAQWTYEFALASLATGLPTLVTAHDAPLNVLRHNPTIYRTVRTFMAMGAIRRARQVVAVSPHVDSHLRRYRFLKNPATIVPNGLPDSLFALMPEQGGRRPQMRFATVLNGWGNYKNGQAAIEAFAQVRRDFPDARLSMFGFAHGPGEAAEQWARQRNLQAGIDFVGPLPHPELLASLARDVDVLVHPALEEAQPMSIIEAMSLGIPVIGGRRSGGVPWTLDEGRAGILVDVGKPAELAGAMSRLASDAGERAEWGRRGRRMAETRYHISAVADAYERLYQQTREAA